MAAKEPTSDLFAGTGTGLQYVGSDPTYAYAYSGVIALASGDYTNLLDFVTGGASVINSNFEQSGNWDDLGNDYLEWNIYFNELQVFHLKENHGDTAISDAKACFIIPPLTRVRVEMRTAGGSATPNWVANMTGRVYKE
mgnify:FL=1